MSKTKAQKAADKAARAVSAAYRSSLGGGNYGAAIANKALVAQLGAMTKAMHTPVSGRMKSPKRQLSKAEKAARKRVRGARAAYASAAARAARLKGGRKRSTVAKKKAASRSAAPAARRAAAPRKPKVPTVTANQVVAAAAKAALRRWACEGPRRSGCGAGGSRVVNHPKGRASLVRIRPPRFMTGA